MLSVFTNSLAKYSLLSVLTVILVSCGGTPEPIKVRQFHLRDTQIANQEAQMIRGEQLYRLNNAVTHKQRIERLGSYYTISWNVPQAAAGGMKVIFEYQQAASASKVLSMTRNLPAGQTKGVIEFNIIGNAYRVGGGVLAWRALLVRGEEIVASKQSYLWVTGR